MATLSERLGEPEQVVAELERSRHLKVFAAIVGIVLGVAAVLALSAAMYSDEPNVVPPASTPTP